MHTPEEREEFMRVLNQKAQVQLMDTDHGVQAMGEMTKADEVWFQLGVVMGASVAFDMMDEVQQGGELPWKANPLK